MALSVSRKRVERLMREAGLQGAFLRKRSCTGSTRQNPRASPAPDLVQRDFTARAPDRLWVADVTSSQSWRTTNELPAEQRLSDWLTALVAEKRVTVAEEPELFDTYRALAAEHGKWRSSMSPA